MYQALYHENPTIILFYFISIVATGRKVLALNAPPTINLPKKSHETVTKERRVFNKQTTVKNVIEAPVYKNSANFCSRADKLTLNGWTLQLNEDQVKLKFFLPKILIPKYEVIVDTSINYQCFVFGWRVPSVPYSLHDVTISYLLGEITEENVEDLVVHTIPHEVDISDSDPYKSEQYMRSQGMSNFGQ